MPKILLLDDQPEYPTSVLIPGLQAQHDVVYVSDVHAALQQLQSQAFDLIILDLLLDEGVPQALAAQEKTVRQALKASGHHNSYSAQSLGLWLWGQSPRLPYCYLSSYPALRMAGLSHAAAPPEFDGASQQQLAKLVCERGLEAANPCQFVDDVKAIWAAKGW